MIDTTDANVLGLTAQIVAAHAEHKQVAAEVLPDLIHSVYRSLATVTLSEAKQEDTPIPAVPVFPSNAPYFQTSSSALRTGKS